MEDSTSIATQLEQRFYGIGLPCCMAEWSMDGRAAIDLLRDWYDTAVGTPTGRLLRERFPWVASGQPAEPQLVIDAVKLWYREARWGRV